MQIITLGFSMYLFYFINCTLIAFESFFTIIYLKKILVELIVSKIICVIHPIIKRTFIIILINKYIYWYAIFLAYYILTKTKKNNSKKYIYRIRVNSI